MHNFIPVLSFDVNDQLVIELPIEELRKILRPNAPRKIQGW